MRLYSQSVLQDYLDCPRRFQLRYLRNLNWPAPRSTPLFAQEEHEEAGARFHRLVQQYYLGLPETAIERLASTPDLQRWWKNFVGSTHRPSRDLPGARFFTEALLSFPVHTEARLVARFDLVLMASNGHVLIVDWKTSRKRPHPLSLLQRMQTRLYRFLMVVAGQTWKDGEAIVPSQVEMLYWFAEYPEDPVRFSYSEEEYQRDFEWFPKLIQEIENAAAFPPTEESRICMYCPYRSYCARGVRAGSWEEMDEETERTSIFDVNFEQVAEIAF